MKLLVIGGTIFLGRHLVDAARAAGHTVTLFNRGKHNPDLFPGVERITGDRDGDLPLLAGRSWDAVIDTCGYVPRLVRASAEALSDCGHYTFVSSISVYAAFDRPGIDEHSPVGLLDDPTLERIDGETYGPLKGLCEQAVRAALPGRALVVRPGLIVGPHDPTERFTYWPRRIARGGPILAPGDPRGPVQFIDARDLAAWMLQAAEQRLTGTFNATGPAERLTMGAFLDGCIDALDATAEPIWISEEVLREQGVTPWTELPLWVHREDRHLNEIDCSKAVGAGLLFRPLAETVRDTLAWHRTRTGGERDGGTLTAGKERDVIAAWRAQNSQ